MTTSVITPTQNFKSPADFISEKSLIAFNMLSAVPERLSDTKEQLIAERRNGLGPLVIVFIVAIAVLLVLASAVTTAVIIFCSQKGMNFEWMVKTSWFEMKVACRK